jgi:hypothetical protein
VYGSWVRVARLKASSAHIFSRACCPREDMSCGLKTLVEGETSDASPILVTNTA